MAPNTPTAAPNASDRPARSRPQRSRRALRHRPPPGAAPGTLIADPDSPAPVLRVIAYGPEAIHEAQCAQASEVRSYLDRWPVVWINVDGLGDTETIRSLGEIFALHSLVLEDIVNLYQRPKAEAYESQLFLVTRMVQPGSPVDTEQVSMVLGKTWLLTFQERPGDSFDPVRHRLRRGGPIRARPPDYLAYALLDASLDAFFPVLETFSERIEDVRDEILAAPRPEVLEQIHYINRDLITIRRAVWPQRDMLSWLTREAENFITPTTQTYLRDTYDHCIQLIDLNETARELTRGLTDLHMTTAAMRTNEVMRVLTMVATVFIPLGFIAGVYGMNFDPGASPLNMPELEWRYGYPAVLGLMAAVAGGLLWQFRRRGWMGGKAAARRRRARRPRSR